MKFRRNCLLISLGFALLSPSCAARATVIEGAWDQFSCKLEWHAWALNAAYYDRPGNFYEVAHGDSRGALLYCGRPELTPDQIVGYSFGFFASCGGLCSNANGTFAESVEESVGWCAMAEPECAACWWVPSMNWQDTFYQNKTAGMTLEESFDAAMNVAPECLPCIRMHRKRKPEEPNPTQLVVTTVIIQWLMRHR